MWSLASPAPSQRSPRAVLLAAPTLLGILWAAVLAAAVPPCRPCAGLLVADPAAVAAALASHPRLPEGARLYVASRVPLDREADLAPFAAVAAAGGTPWLRVVFRSPAPLTAHLAELDGELAALAALADQPAAGTHFQVLWEPPGGAPDANDYAFLLKRASVAIAGAQPDARVITRPLPPRTDDLEALYAEEVAAYLEGIALAPPGAGAATPIGAGELAAAVARLGELDPGRPVVLDALPAPEEPALALAAAAEGAAAGAAVVFFAPGAGAEAAMVPPLVLLAREFAGDLSYDAATAPQGVPAGWTFVRGEDLGLRVVLRLDPSEARPRVRFADPFLDRPRLVAPATGEEEAVFRFRRTGDGVEVELDRPGPVAVLHLARRTAGEIEGVAGLEEQVEVRGEREIPVEEIVRRLQAFEDAQGRLLATYQAVNTTSLRFQVGTGARGVDVTFRGRFFFRQGNGFDWAWEELYVDGVRWRSKWVPDIPLVQPEKAAAMPVEITFGKEYRYRLRGTQAVRGRDCWVVEFEPAAAAAPGRTLYQGTVWIDREMSARVRTRAVQLGLAGEVLSNEETLDYEPLDRAGRAAPWAAGSYFLPTHTVGQQIWSLLSAATVVERETRLTEVAINHADFEASRAAVLASPVTMLRDTPGGLRYLELDEATGERVVKEDLSLKKRFIVGGVFHDDSLDFPIPLAGMNWLWLDFGGTGRQANVFFGGALLSVALTDPSLAGSRFDLGFDAFALAVAGTDRVFRDGREAPAEDVESRSPNLDVKIGRPLGNFAKLTLQYELAWVDFSRADDTADDFVVPSDHLRHEISLGGSFSRSGYRLQLGGTYGVRSDWEPWGRPTGGDFAPGDDSYARWGAAFGKVWHLAGFQKLGLELAAAGGSGLDRFSKVEFGFFSDVRVRGYRSGKVRAEEALAARASYGFEIGQAFRLDLLADAAWATDRETGLDRELLAGTGLAGTVALPWGLVVNVDVGQAVAGPDDGFTAFVTLLKLFR